jgi:prolyl-tRNA editing enzyme YbaK/EbsC (Cys-tRNA(Pro) deacylase)
MTPRLGSLELRPALERPDLLAAPVAAALRGAAGNDAWVTEIDPGLADTAALIAAHGLDPDDSGNCVIVLGKRGGELRPAACVILASTRADVNGLARKHLEARKASFAPQDWAVAETDMEYGGITPVGLPPAWPILIDSAVTERVWVIVGSGLRRSKLVLPGSALTLLSGAVVLDGLGQPPAG